MHLLLNLLILGLLFPQTPQTDPPGPQERAARIESHDTTATPDQRHDATESAARWTQRLLPEPERPALTLTLDEAIQIAVVNNYAVRNSRLDVTDATAQVREAWGQVLPQVDVQSSYTRNLRSPNPFAGSEAGGFFASFGFIDWLSYNERARTDDDPTTSPIPYDEFLDRRQAGLDELGRGFAGSDNPFAVPNEFLGGITVSQTLYNGAAFAAIKGAERLQDIFRYGVARQEQVVIDDVRRAFYQALLAEHQAAVTYHSVLRTAATLDDMTKQVAQGVAPKFQRLSAEVELANLETQLLQVRNQAAQALDVLKMQIGMPVDQPLQLRGSLESVDPTTFLNVSVDDAVEAALQRRPDVEQARIAVDLRRIDRDISRGAFLPTVTAFANANYMGRVPDDRTRIMADADDPFQFTMGSTGFFSQSYWNPSVNAGVRLSWNIFNGFQTSARVQQRTVSVNKAQVDYEQTVEGVRLEVQNALRDLETARRRIFSQEQTVLKAELNYEYAQARLREGVASQLEERAASDQLDQSRLNYLQAAHDFLVARSAFETAVGMPVLGTDGYELTSNEPLRR